VWSSFAKWLSVVLPLAEGVKCSTGFKSGREKSLDLELRFMKLRAAGTQVVVIALVEDVRNISQL
jgi:hypothetical protein